MRKRRFGRLGSVVIAAMAIALTTAAHADAFVYWADSGSSSVDGSIGRANLDGTGVDRSFIPGLNNPCGLAVDSQHIYWGNHATNSIGRANLDGTEVDPTFIVNDSGAANPCGVAVDGSHVWWANVSGAGGDGSIGRANLDGTAVQSTFFNSPGSALTPIAVGLGGGFAFWSNSDLTGPGPITPSIARAGVEGAPPPILNLIPLSSPILPSWTVADDSHVYFEMTYLLLDGIQLQRAGLDGTIDTPNEFWKIDGSGGLALHGGQLYWANGGEGTVSRANPDGTDPDFAFIRGAGSPFGLAVDGGVPSNDFSLGQLTRNKKAGTAQLAVTPAGPGSVSLAGNGVKPVSVDTDGSAVTLPIVAAGKQKQRLKRRGKAKLSLAITFAPTGANANTETTTVKLIHK